jgi:hypothetical protein
VSGEDGKDKNKPRPFFDEAVTEQKEEDSRVELLNLNK